MTKLIAVFLVSPLLLSLSACSSGSSGSQGSGIVLAQSGYTNASLTGTYAFSIVAPYNGGGAFYDEIGTITFDGSGHITGGSGTAYFATSSTSCASTNLTGTYSVQTSGAGSGTLSSTVSGTGCSGGLSSLPITFQVAASGATIEFGSGAGSTQVFAGSATKQ
jgi:hypothetical protein